MTRERDIYECAVPRETDHSLEPTKVLIINIENSEIRCGFYKDGNCNVPEYTKTFARKDSQCFLLDTTSEPCSSPESIDECLERVFGQRFPITEEEITTDQAKSLIDLTEQLVRNSKEGLKLSIGSVSQLVGLTLTQIRYYLKQAQNIGVTTSVFSKIGKKDRREWHEFAPRDIAFLWSMKALIESGGIPGIGKVTKAATMLKRGITQESLDNPE